MRQFGITSNIMSLSGIAIAIGVLVDAGIVMTENVIRHCERHEEAKADRRVSPGRKPGRQHWRAAKQVGRPIFFAMVIIIFAFVPVFTLVGEEGKLFHPLAFTKTFAMVGATLLAVTMVPVLCTFLVRGPFHPEERNWMMKRLPPGLRSGAQLGTDAPPHRSGIGRRPADDRDRARPRAAAPGGAGPSNPGICPASRRSPVAWAASSCPP